MQTFRLIVFVVSIIALPALALALAKSKIRIPGKIILFAGLAIAARYLLGAAWTPEEMSMVWLKEKCVCYSFFAWYLVFLSKMDIDGIRPWVAFAIFMAIPFIARFCCCVNLVGEGFSLMKTGLWIAWTMIGIWVAAIRHSQKSYSAASRVAVAIIAAVVLVFLISGNVRGRTLSYAGTLSEHLRQDVIERWEPLKRSTEKIVSAWEELVEKDRRTMAKGKIGTRKIVASVKISSQISKLQADLLTVDSRIVLFKIAKLDSKIASAKKKLSALREELGYNPEKAGRLDAKIAKAEGKLAKLEAARAEAIATARRDLKEIGLDLPENSPFLTVDLGALIDNAIVAKNIGFLVENLKANMDAAKGDAEAAKRYYGAYIVMLDVQAECFRQYLDKAATGIWRDGVSDIAKNAEAAKKIAEAKAAVEGRTEEERAAFLHAAGTNEKTLKVAQAYLAILKRHEEVVKEKLDAVEKKHEIALSFWESVDIASDFSGRIAADLADFDALLQLKLPEIAFFDDVAMAQEFDAITQKLVKE